MMLKATIATTMALLVSVHGFGRTVSRSSSRRYVPAGSGGSSPTAFRGRGSHAQKRLSAPAPRWQRQRDVGEKGWAELADVAAAVQWRVTCCLGNLEDSHVCGPPDDATTLTIRRLGTHPNAMPCHAPAG
eukprot:scaffold3115_cov234-Pinguiococcus_pyrenoidosus.AAC.6